MQWFLTIFFLQKYTNFPQYLNEYDGLGNKTEILLTFVIKCVFSKNKYFFLNFLLFLNKYFFLLLLKSILFLDIKNTEKNPLSRVCFVSKWNCNEVYFCMGQLWICGTNKRIIKNPVNVNKTKILSRSTRKKRNRNFPVMLFFIKLMCVFNLWNLYHSNH